MRCKFKKAKDSVCGMAFGNTVHHNKTQFGYHEYVEPQEEDMTELDDRLLVPRQDYETLKDTVLQLQTKYQALLDDKQRWRNFALLSAATNLVAERAYTPEHAIRIARGLLTLIERGGDNVEPGERS